MSEENVGTITYTIKAETDAILMAERDVAKSTSGIQLSFEKTDNSVNKTDKSLATLNTRVSKTALAVNTATQSMGRMRGAFGQLGYQLQDVAVQLQTGQSALVVFAQQGSQLASIFGPGGAVVGAIIAVAGALASALLPGLMDSTTQTEKLVQSIEDLGKVIRFSENGVAGLSDEYAKLAKVNATLARNAQELAVREMERKVKSAGKAITEIVDAQSSWWRSLAGGNASINLMGDSLKALNITTNDYRAATVQAVSAGEPFQQQMMTIGSTVGMLASQFDISEQDAYALGKQLSELGDTPTPEKLNEVINSLKGVETRSDAGQAALDELAKKLNAAGAAGVLAKDGLEQAKREIEGLVTAAQNANFENLMSDLKQQEVLLKDGADAAEQNTIATANMTEKQKEAATAQLQHNQELKRGTILENAHQRVVLSGLTGVAKARKAAEFQASDLGFKKGTAEFTDFVNSAVKAYQNIEAQRGGNKAATSESSIQQKIDGMRQKSELAANSTEVLSREQAILNAQLSLGANATSAQKEEIGQYAAKAWDAANALKAQAAAEKALPEIREKKKYEQDVNGLRTALNLKLIDQKRFNAESEKLAAQHEVNLAKIRAGQKADVNPMQEFAAGVDPVQSLANQHAEQLALIDEYNNAALGIVKTRLANESLSATEASEQMAAINANTLALKTAQETQYEQQRLAALEQQYRAQSQLNDFTMSMIDAVGQRSTNMITGLLTGTQSVNDAVRGLAATILNQAVGALVQMGIQALKNMIIGETASAASVAQAAISGPAIAAAYGPAAAMVSLASYGANAAPAQAGIMSTVGVAKVMSLAGGRRYGGGVSAGNLYRFNESGESEIYQTAGGAQAFLPNKSGKIIPADEAWNGGGNEIQWTFIVNNSSSAEVGLQSVNEKAKIVTMTVKEVSRQLRSQTGPISSSLKDSWNITGKTQ